MYDKEKNLPIIIGKELSGEDVIVDLQKLPHLLITGGSGQGKTECLDSIITSLLCKKDPSEIKFVFIDTKMVELCQYAELNQSFIAQLEGEEESVINELQTAKRILESLHQENYNRRLLLCKANAKSIVEYNDKYSKGLLSVKDGFVPMPYIIIVIDEIADLMMTYEEEIEHSLLIIGALGRIVGMHLVLTTVRPSENVLTYRLKAHLEARIAFKLNNSADSIRVIDNEAAAYLNRGEMLFSYSNSVNHLKLASIDSDEIESIIKSINNTHSDSKPFILPSIEEEGL